MTNKEFATTFVMMVRDESDIFTQNIEYHLRLGFDRYVIISHIEHQTTRDLVDKLRTNQDIEIVSVELDAITGFSRRKAIYINNTIGLSVDPDVRNIVFCADADDFLHMGRFKTISELVSSWSKRTPPLYFTLPWIDLIASDHNDDTLNIQNQDFLALEDSGWNGTKVLFEVAEDRTIHMGYHWLVDSNGTRMTSTMSENAFVANESLCVYHLPFRSFNQFSARMSCYAQSADVSAKYNVLNRLLTSHADRMSLHSVFEWCIASEPKFDGLHGLGQFLDTNINSAAGLETIAKFLTARRYKVGRVLSSGK